MLFTCLDANVIYFPREVATFPAIEKPVQDARLVDLTSPPKTIKRKLLMSFSRSIKYLKSRTVFVHFTHCNQSIRYQGREAIIYNMDG